METVLMKYGAGAELALEFAPEALIARCGMPEGEPLDDPAAAVAAVLDGPLDFPALREAIVPGDRIAIALEHGVPQAACLVAGVVKSLMDAGTAPEDISVVRSLDDSETSTADPRGALAKDIASRVQLATHNPNCRDELGYLAAAKDGNPIYVNRVLSDADVVLPIGYLRAGVGRGDRGAFGGVFPAFSDAATQVRFRTPRSHDTKARRKQRRMEVEEAGWWLGIMLTIQIVPGPGDSVLHVLAGAAKAVQRRGRELCRCAWRDHVPQRASLVVAGIEGGARQTWDDVGRALIAASRAVTDGGAIAICSELETEPGAALQHLIGNEDFEAASRAIRRQGTADADAAWELLRALDNYQIFLLSRLPDDVVEELGMAPVGSGKEIARLANRHPSCIVLSNAQYAIPKVHCEEETAAPVE